MPRKLSGAESLANTLLFLTLFLFEDVRSLDLKGLGQLIVKCQMCGARYPSGIVTDFEIIQRDPKSLLEVRTTCPFCRHENLGKPRSMVFTSASI